MQVNQTLNDGLKRGFQFVVPGSVLDDEVEKKLVSEQPNIQMNGFRKGKVPLSLMRKLYGRGVKEEVREVTIKEALESHFSDSDETSATTPSVEIESTGAESGEDLTFNVTYEAFPAIPDVDFKSINVERLVVTPDDELIQERLENLARIYGDYENADADAKAELGNLVVLNFKGYIDGEEIEEGSGEGFPVELGKDLIGPGFDDQLVGAEVGSMVQIKVNYDDSHSNETFRGKEVQFSCQVKELKTSVPSQIDDELAVRVGLDDLEDLRITTKVEFEATLAEESLALLRYRLFNRLDEILDFELPPSLREAEIGSVVEQLAIEEELEGRNTEAESAEDSREEEGERTDSENAGHGSVAKAEKPEPNAEHIRIAERRLRIGLFFAHLGRQNDIEVTNQDLERAAERMAAQSRQLTKVQVLEFMRLNREYMSNIRQQTFERKVIEFLFELVEITEREASVKELREAIAEIED